MKSAKSKLKMAPSVNCLKMPSIWLEMPVSVLLVGVGGTGSHVLDALFAIHSCLLSLGGSGLHVTAIDDDCIEQHNIGRQRYWNPDIGQSKALISIQRLNIFGGTSWEAIQDRIEPTSDTFLRHDVVITAVDDGEFRAKLGQHYSKTDSDVLWIDTGVGGEGGQVIMGHLGKAREKIPNVYDLYGKALATRAYNKQREQASCGSLRGSLAAQGLFANRIAANCAADLLFTLVRQGRIEFHGSFFDSAPLQVTRLAIDPQIWRTFPAFRKH